MRILLRLMSMVVPAGVRPRWREEWLAELECVARSRGRRRALRVALGALPDAMATRRLSSAARRWSATGAGSFHGLDQDLRYALRRLVKSPGFAAGVVLSLAIGIGANAAAFTFLNAAVFRPFPGVRNQHELVRFTLGSASYQKFSTVGTSYRDYLTMREALTTIDGLSAVRDATFAVFADGQASAVRGGLVSGNYFDVLGIVPAAGRFFLAHEDVTPGTNPVVVISDALWEQLFSRAPSAIGQSLLVNGSPLQIVGVAPAEFIGVRRAETPPRIWVPMAMGELTLRSRSGRSTSIESAGPLWLDYVGRRRAGVSIDQVSAEAATLRERLETTRSDVRSRVSVLGVWLNDPARMSGAIVGFMIVPMLVLAIACVNAANLVLARSSRSARDWTVRLAVGATRWRVVRQVLAEAVILSMAAALLGLLLTRWGLSLVAHQFPVPMPVDHRVAMFTIGIAFLTAVSFSLGPALSVTMRAARRLSPVYSGAGGPARSRTRFALVALQAALSLGLLATGAQFTKTVQAAADKEHIPGAESLVLASFDVDPLRLEREAGDDFYLRLVDRVSRVPGIAAAGFATNGLVTGTMGRDGFARVWLPDSPPDGKPQIAFQVSGRFLDAVAVPLLRGRRFTTVDEGSVRTVVVNKAFADKILLGDGLGRTFRLSAPAAAPRDRVEPRPIVVDHGLPTFRPPAAEGSDAVEVTVVGVVDGILKRGDQEPPIVYYPAPLVYQPARTLYIRLDRTVAFNAAALYAAARDVDARVPVTDLATLSEIRRRKDREVKVLTRAVGVLGILALLLAAGGLYSVVAYIVSLRRQEVGVRLAFGADPAAIVGMIVWQALVPTLTGAAVGAGGAAAAGALIRSRMYGATPVDPAAFGAATLLMLGVMLAASWLPARQAGRVNPVTVLRADS